MKLLVDPSALSLQFKILEAQAFKCRFESELIKAVETALKTGKELDVLKIKINYRPDDAEAIWANGMEPLCNQYGYTLGENNWSHHYSLMDYGWPYNESTGKAKIELIENELFVILTPIVK